MSNTTINSNLATATGTIDFNALFNLTPEQLVQAPAQSTKEILDGAYAKQRIANPTDKTPEEKASEIITQALAPIEPVVVSEVVEPPFLPNDENAASTIELSLAKTVIENIGDLRTNAHADLLIAWLCRMAADDKDITDYALAHGVECFSEEDGGCKITITEED